MIKDNVRIKDYLSFIDRAKIIEDLVAGYFPNGEYKPYYREINDVIVFFKYCVEGLTFEYKEDENGERVLESIYTAVMLDDDLKNLYENVRNPYYGGDKTVVDQLESLEPRIAEMVELEKQKLIYKNDKIEELLIEILRKESRNKDLEMKAMKDVQRVHKAQAKQIEYANKVSSFMTPEETAAVNKQMANGELDYDKMTKIVTEMYLNSDLHKDNLNSVIDEKNKKIKELESYKKEKEAFNVLADK